jgi:hypothetical protein
LGTKIGGLRFGHHREKGRGPPHDESATKTVDCNLQRHPHRTCCKSAGPKLCLREGQPKIGNEQRLNGLRSPVVLLLREMKAADDCSSIALRYASLSNAIRHVWPDAMVPSGKKPAFLASPIFDFVSVNPPREALDYCSPPRIVETAPQLSSSRRSVLKIPGHTSFLVNEPSSNAA